MAFLAALYLWRAMQVELLGEGTQLVPPHRNHLPGVESDVVSRRVFIWLVYGALEHGASTIPVQPS